MATWLLVLGLAACASKQPTVATSPGSSNVGSGETRRNPQLGLSWTLPRDWEFVPLENFGFESESLPIGMLVARKRGSRLPFIVVAVRELYPTGRDDPADSAKDLAHLEEDGRRRLALKGATNVSSRRISIAGNQGVEAVGFLGDQQRLTARFFFGGRREFHIQCFTRADEGASRCDPALASLEISEPPPPSLGDTTPKVFHLRDLQCGVEFDAPSDTWRAVGPTTSGGGAQRVWTWSDGQHWVDVQTFDMSWLPKPPDEESLANKLAETARSGGSTVTVQNSSLSGLPSVHLVIDRPDGQAHDAFIVNRGTTNYILRVRQTTRDTTLIAKVKAGFRFAAQ